MGQPEQIEQQSDPVASWCLGCDYPLKGLTENRCPECGRVFYPRDPDTMRTAETPGRIAQWIMRPPGRRSHVVAILGVIFVLACGVAPNGYTGFTLSVLYWVLLIPMWGIRFFLWLTVHLTAYGGVGLRLNRRAANWLVIPLAMIVSFASIKLGIPLRIGFLVSHGAMETLAADTINSSGGSVGKRWVGIYYAKNIERTAWGMQFTVVGTEPEVGGFAYSPGQLPASSSASAYYYPIGGNWYTWVEHW